MAKDTGDLIGSVIGTIAREITENVSPDGNGNGHHLLDRGGDGVLSGARGVAAGAALAAAVPMAGMAAKKIVLRKLSAPSADSAKDAGAGIVGKVSAGAKGRVEDLTEGAKNSVGKGVKEAVSDKVGEADAPGLVKGIGKKMIPGGGGGESKGKKGTPGVGKGRRMPVQQEVDIGVPLSVAYNQWTQFEEWPQFMHRLDQATQEDDCTVSFRTKIWGMSKEFVGQVVEQRPDERIQWTVKEGVAHTGVVIFHELAPNLTRVQVTLDVEPGSLREKAARGMRHVKRAVRADLHRFKAFIEMQEVETGAWRGEIHDGEVVEKHDRKYDRQREYADFDDVHDKESSHKPQRQQSSPSRKSSSGRGSSSRKSSSRKSSSSGRSRVKSRPKSQAKSRKRGSASKRGSSQKRSRSPKSGSARS